ncbi:MAG: SANT/Myb-like DNA-binding domain-containing protein [Candidatus Thiodiazotropha sp.]
MVKRKRWTAEEDEFICAHYQAYGLQWVADRMPERTRGGVAKRAGQLGVNGIDWTGAEDYVIRTCYRHFGAAYCRQYMPRRSEVAIMIRARRIGVAQDRKKSKKTMPGHDEIGCQQAAIKTGWMNPPEDLPEGFFELVSTG